MIKLLILAHFLIAATGCGLSQTHKGAEDLTTSGPPYITKLLIGTDTDAFEKKDGSVAQSKENYSPANCVIFLNGEPIALFDVGIKAVDVSKLALNGVNHLSLKIDSQVTVFLKVVQYPSTASRSVVIVKAAFKRGGSSSIDVPITSNEHISLEQFAIPKSGPNGSDFRNALEEINRLISDEQWDRASNLFYFVRIQNSQKPEDFSQELKSLFAGSKTHINNYKIVRGDRTFLVYGDPWTDKNGRAIISADRPNGQTANLGPIRFAYIRGKLHPF